MKDYLKVGEAKVVNGKVCIQPGFFDDGLTQGSIFKDEEAYENDWDAICYVPEYGFEKDTEDNDNFYREFDGYSHNDLLRLCWGNREWCDYLFHSQCLWAYPETYIAEADNNDIAYFYRFIKVGAKVWWNDPAGETSGEYIVYNAPCEYDECGELADGQEWDLDDIVLIATDYSEAEVYVHELTPIYDN